MGSGRITGRVLDSITHRPVEYATIILFYEGSSQAINGASTNDKGVFVIDSLPWARYNFIVNFIGYKPVTKAIVLSASRKSVSAGVIELVNSAALAAVTVNAETAILENKIDKFVYNAERDLTAQSGSASDLLKKVPQVVVTANGTVELNGTPGVQVLINGKPSAVFGARLSDALQSIPANQIKTIEVITSPGARYDAEGGGGIINIILKQNHLQGINGSMAVSTETRMENASLNISARSGTFGITASIGTDDWLPSGTVGNMNRTTQDSVNKTKNLLQNLAGQLDRTAYNLHTGFDWDITPKNNISGGFAYSQYTYHNKDFSHEQLFTIFGTVTDTISTRNEMDHQVVNGVDINLDYRKTFRKPGQELFLSYQTNIGNTTSYYGQEQQYANAPTPFYGSQSANVWRNEVTYLRGDYIQPLGKSVTLELGAKAIIKRVVSNADYYGLNTALNTYQPDTSLANYILYHRDIYSGYASISFKLFRLFDVKAGFRYERTETRANFSSADVVPLPGYDLFAPSALISHSFRDRQTIRLSYSRRISRPDYQWLNPYINAADPLNLTTGNPKLAPEEIHYAEFSYSKTYKSGASLLTSAYYRYSANSLQTYEFYYPSLSIGDSTYKNAAVSTYANVGPQHLFGFNLTAVFPLKSNIRWRTTFSGYNLYIINNILPGNTSNSFNYHVNTNLNYKINDNLSLEFTGDFIGKWDPLESTCRHASLSIL